MIKDILNKIVLAEGTPSVNFNEIQKPDIPITTLPQVFTFVINLVLGVGIAVTIIFLILGGIQYITAKGDAKAAGAARDALTNAVIGFIVVIGAFTIKTIVLNALGVTNVQAPGVVNPTF